MQKGTFVTAKLKGKNDSRQGVFVNGTQEEFSILSESGAVYKCEGQAVVISDCCLWGSTKRFVLRYRANWGGSSMDKSRETELLKIFNDTVQALKQSNLIVNSTFKTKDSKISIVIKAEDVTGREYG
ncbi:hypothetical protein LCGC14_2591910 [marine sediment metagenome]|uniref:Uncharacterized protein n=1 Tax=marine sediment metagenome TaxID=412755 RepID=A0A0F9ABN3_9ZZZZ